MCVTQTVATSWCQLEGSLVQGALAHLGHVLSRGGGTEPAELEPGRCVGATSVAMPWELRGTQGRLPSHEVLAKALYM